MIAIDNTPVPRNAMLPLDSLLAGSPLNKDELPKTVVYGLQARTSLSTHDAAS